MRIFRTATSALISGFLVLAFVSGHATANAATQNLVYDCLLSAPVTLSVAPGDVLNFTSNCGGGLGATTINTSLFSTSPAPFTGFPASFTVSSSLATGTYAGAFQLSASTTTTYSLQYGSSGGSTSSAQSPPDWLQGYGRSQGESCRTGWSESWAQWPNSGVGGFVCHRTVTWQGEPLGGS